MPAHGVLSVRYKGSNRGTVNNQTAPRNIRAGGRNINEGTNVTVSQQKKKLEEINHIHDFEKM